MGYWYDRAIALFGFAPEARDFNDCFENYEVWAMCCQSPDLKRQVKELESLVVDFAAKDAGEDPKDVYFSAETKLCVIKFKSFKLVMVNGMMQVQK